MKLRKPLALIVLFAIMLPAALNLANKPVSVAPPVHVAVPVAAVKPDIKELALLVNKDRADAGIAPLVEDSRLDASAAAHCADMARLNEWGHNLTDGTTPQTFITAVFPNWQHSAENTAWGWNTATIVNDKLMNSPGHKDNILNPSYTLVGYAQCDADKYPNIVVQEFVGI